MERARITLDCEAATTRLGRAIADGLGRGDVVALDGALGVGKSVLARAIITHFFPDESEMPSPTFTLVQGYGPETGVQVMHFDLYRLDGPHDALELGIEEAFADAVSLVEWPQRLGGMLPARALFVTLEMVGGHPDARTALIGGGPGETRWDALVKGLAGGV